MRVRCRTFAATRPQTTLIPPASIERHPIADLDGDDVRDAVLVNETQGVRSIGLQLSRDPSCASLDVENLVDAGSSVNDIIGANDLDGDDRPLLWLEVSQNSGYVVVLAERTGCTLRSLDRPNGQRFDAYVPVFGHLCCPDVTAVVRCVKRADHIEIVASTASPTVAPPGDYKNGPYRWDRERLRVLNGRVETIAKTNGTVSRRGLIPAAMLDGGFHCSGVNV